MRSTARCLPLIASIALIAIATLTAVAAPPPPATHALLINGGGVARTNYLSHLHHLQDMAAELRNRGIPPERIDVFSADGEDERADLATREPEAPDRWLIEGTPTGSLLTTPDLTNTVWEGVKLRPARVKELRKWFAGMSKTLRPGDTLFVFVTDHGNKDADDPDNGFISLWNETLTVLDFRALLAHLKPGVRVVNVMSQCFSGAFADAMTPLNAELPSGDVCGFYSTPRDRPAYGCYPEGRDRDKMGHAFRTIEAMSRHGASDDAHAAVLLLDNSPDVPIRTSDLFLEKLLVQEAEATGKKFETLVDENLALAWKNRARWEPQIRLMDRIGEVYGFPSARTLAELKPRVEALEALSAELSTYESRWNLSLDDLRKDNMEKFLEQTPEWKIQLEPKAVGALDRDTKKALLKELLAAVREFTEARPEIHARLNALRATSDDARNALYVVDVRLASLLRMGALLVSVAGSYSIDNAPLDGAPPGETGPTDRRRALDGLTRCEGSVIGSFEAIHESSVLREAPEPLPPLTADLAAVRRALPSWLGISFRPLSDAQKERFEVARGAVFIQQVFPDGPAAAAGLEIGDILLGPPGRHFAEPTQVREWTMSSPRSVPLTLEIVRDGKIASVDVTLVPYPTEFPAIPPPPKEGDKAPKLGSLRMVRPDTLKAAKLDGTRHMVFFWATWCAPCKAAVPQLLEWSARTGVPVLAISDEDEDTVKKFLSTWTEGFPGLVASDELRRTYMSFAVSGTPTFVLIDAKGKIEWRKVGFSVKEGLKIP